MKKIHCGAAAGADPVLVFIFFTAFKRKLKSKTDTMIFLTNTVI
jgi:hypothetical protein